MEALLTVIMLWLSANFDLQQSFSHPAIVVESSANIHALHYGGSMQRGNLEGAHRDGHPSQVVAVYVDTTSTIHLAEGWTGTTPEELSILVHEMTHHLQHVGGHTYACPQEREKLAFAAQEQWLAMFGGSLLESFGIDSFTLLARTTCAF